MIDTLINVVTTVLGWVASTSYYIGYFFRDVADYCADITVVGPSLYSLFFDIYRAFITFGDYVLSFKNSVRDVLEAIQSWLEEIPDIINAINGWISDKVDLAYSWATGAWDWIVDTGENLADIVFNWVIDRVYDAYNWAEDALYWIAETGQDLASTVSGWITETLNEAYALASDAWTWIEGAAATLADIPNLIKAELLQIVGPVFNLVEYYFQDISDFFSDPSDYFVKKLELMGESFAERMWGVVETIIEKIW